MKPVLRLRFLNEGFVCDFRSWPSFVSLSCRTAVALNELAPSVLLTSRLGGRVVNVFPVVSSFLVY